MAQEKSKPLNKMRKKIFIVSLLGITAMYGSVGYPQIEGYNDFEKCIEQGKTGKFKEALASCTQAIEKNPNVPEYFNARARVYYDLKDWDAAIQDASQGINAAQNDRFVKIESLYLMRAICYFKKRDFENAILDYSKFIEINPNKPNVYFDRAEAYLESGQKDKALEDLEKGKALDGKIPLELLKKIKS